MGAHPAAAVRPAKLDDAKRLVDAGRGLVKLLTLAPERDASGTTTRWLTDQQIVVSAGHCNSSLDQLRSAIDSGLSMFTHLGNGCPLMLHRHENIIQRVLSLTKQLWICFIADGVHVPFPALGNYLRSVDIDRVIVTSDAIAAAGKGPGIYSLAGQQVRVDEALATWSIEGDHLVGSATPLSQSYENLIQHLGLRAEVAGKMVSDNPRLALGIL